MRRMILWAGLLALPCVPGHAQQAPQTKHSQDPRLARLKSFFGSVHCPVRALSQEFLDAADRHHLDWRLLPSISLIETGGGKNAPGNNIFGWDSGRKAFTSVRRAIADVASRLATSKLYRGKNLDGILATYNPRPDYARRIKLVMQQVGPASLLPEETALLAAR